MSINKVTISGNLTRKPEMSTTASGLAVINFNVAVNDRRRNAQGEWEDYANFIDCAMFGKRAEYAASRLDKGSKVCIEGKLHYSSWEDRNGGGRRSKVSVNVDEIEYMNAAHPSTQPVTQQPVSMPEVPPFDEAAYRKEAQAQQMTTGAIAAEAYSTEDIPF